MSEGNVSSISSVLDCTSSRSLSILSRSSGYEAIRFSIDLVSAAKHNIVFLRSVGDAVWLYERTTLLHAVRRYEELWMPLISLLSVEAKPPLILPPFDVEWVWYCHSLNPAHYRKYCMSKFSKLIGKPAIFDEETQDYAFNRCRELWNSKYPDHPFDNELDYDDPPSFKFNQEILDDVLRQRNLWEHYSEPYMSELVYLIAANRRYKKFLSILQKFSDIVDEDADSKCHYHCSVFVPTCDISIMWLTHQSYPTVYASDLSHLEDVLLKVAGPWDMIRQQDVEEMKKLWEKTYQQPYEKAGGRIESQPAGDSIRPVKQPPLVSWGFSDTDVNNARYRSLHPRFMLEVCVFVRLRSHQETIRGKKIREFLVLQILQGHKELKLKMPVCSFLSDSWEKLGHLYCEFGTKGINFVLRCPGSLCGTRVLENVSFTWNSLLRSPSLAIGRDLDQKVMIYTSITPPIQGPYLLKCVPDRVTDDSGAMISEVILRLNQYRPQEGRWISRTVLDHAQRECFIIRIRVGGGFWRRGGETPETVKREDRIIEIREGSWSYAAGSIGKAPDKVVGTAKPKDESKEREATWCLSTGDELTIRWEPTSSIASLSYTLSNQQSSSDTWVKLLKGRRMKYQVCKEQNEVEDFENEEAEGFITLVRFTEENPNGKATALLNWKLLVVEVQPEEDVIFVLLLCVSVLRTVSEMRKEDVGGLLIRRRLKEPKCGMRDWGSVVLHPSCSPFVSSPHVQPWYLNVKAVFARDRITEQMVRQPALNSSLAEGDDKLYKRGILS